MVARLADPDPEVRAQAASACDRRAIATAVGELARALGDSDWRVQVEAVRALAGAHGVPEGRRAVAAALVRAAQRLVDQGEATEAHVLIEGLRALAAHAAKDDQPIDRAIAEAMTIVRGGSGVDATSRAWLGCLESTWQLRFAVEHDYTAPDLRCTLPDHVALPLLGELVAMKDFTIDGRRDGLERLLASADPRVRAAGIAALPSFWGDSTWVERGEIVARIATAFATPDGVLVAAAVEA
ncbi:MAG: HEAT repeat domain-containing protein, partial [Proteobacteria bacterium]|nr:HEAT repeat domain-containing protein [Pseudomonadota bacterium]